MKFIVVTHSAAADELIEITLFLEDRQAGLGHAFTMAFEETLVYLEDFAEARPTGRKKHRSMPIGQFHVFIIYELIIPKVHIKRIIHGARKAILHYRK